MFLRIPPGLHDVGNGDENEDADDGDGCENFNE
jgi:hypothetical protein